MLPKENGMVLKILFLLLVCMGATGCVASGTKVAEEVQINRVLRLEKEIVKQKRDMELQGEHYREKVKHFGAMVDDMQTAVAQAVATKMAESNVSKIRNQLAFAQNQKDIVLKREEANKLKQQQLLIAMETEQKKELAELKSITDKVELERSEKVAKAIGVVKDFTTSGAEIAAYGTGGGGLLAAILGLASMRREKGVASA